MAKACSPRIDGWNVRVSCSSLMLALYGYKETKRKILETLINDLDAVNEQGEILVGVPFERISRFDYCFDFISENFELNPRNFIGHSRTTKSYIEKRTELEVSCVERGGRLETVKLGTLPNRQVVRG